ncbi:hypothetical protein FWG76_01925 [Candidatus Saccharibacteria bacterium]|nr:hypothetical protein [Candidatus Saccharibacteria bacterium]
MSDNEAIAIGGLAHNSKFFGSNMAEIVSAPFLNSSWNDDWSQSVQASLPIWFFGGESSNGSLSGMFGSSRATNAGSAQNHVSHRTILLGY